MLDLDPGKPDPDPDIAGSGSGKTGSRSGFPRIEIRKNRIQTRILPDLDPAKPDLDPVYPDLDPAPFGARSGSSGAQIITKKMR